MLADRRVIAERKAPDEIMGASCSRGGHDLFFGRPGPAKGNILTDRSAEQEYILANIRDLPAQRGARNGCNVLPIYGNRPPGWLVKSQHEIEHRGLAAARGTDQGRHPAGLGTESDATDHGLPRTVGEMHVGK